MITQDSIKTADVRYRFLDDPNDEVLYGTIVIFQTKEEAEVFDAGLQNNDPEWVAFDEQVFYFIHEYLGDSLESYQDENSTSSDFVLVKGEDLD